MNGSGQYSQNINNFQGQPYGPMAPGRMPGIKQEKKDRSGLIKTVCLIFVSLIAVTFIGLFIFMYIQWNTASTDVQGQIDEAVATAEYNLKSQLEAEFEEKEKYPFKTFTGPSDFGSLTFEYPKTWSLYVPDDASLAQDYHAYFNPVQVNVVNERTVMALRVSILNSLTDQVKKRYENKIEEGKLKVTQTVVNNANVDVYTGELDSELQGIFAVVKIRDKTAIIQTDAMIFEKDFYTLLKTVKFNA